VIHILEDHRADAGSFDDGNLLRRKVLISLIVALKSVVMRFALIRLNFFINTFINTSGHRLNQFQGSAVWQNHLINISLTTIPVTIPRVGAVTP